MRDDHEPHEPRERSADDALDLCSSGAAEVYEKADTQARGPQIVDELRAMLASKAAYRLQLDEYAAEANEVRNIDGAKRRPLIIQLEDRLGPERDVARREFEAQALLIRRFEEARAQHAVYLEDRALNPKHLLPTHQLFVWFVWFVWFVVHSHLSDAQVDKNNT